MIKRWLGFMLAVCALVLAGCVAGPAVRPSASAPPLGAGLAPAPGAGGNVYLNGQAYDAVLTINGLPFAGKLSRADASSGWRLALSGTQTEDAEVGGVTLRRTWEVNLDLTKKALTANPNGRYVGRASVAARYDMAPFDRAVFGLVRDARGNGTDFDANRIGGWFSHDDYQDSELAQVWAGDAFTLYVSGLGGGAKQVEKTLGHTLSYLPETPALRINHRLYYDLPRDGETYEYTLQASLVEHAALLRFAKFTGKGRKALPKEPVLRLDLSGALDALTAAETSFKLTEA